jgi:hypothetical protein
MGEDYPPTTRTRHSGCHLPFAFPSMRGTTKDASATCLRHRTHVERQIVSSFTAWAILPKAFFRALPLVLGFADAKKTAGAAGADDAREQNGPRMSHHVACMSRVDFGKGCNSLILLGTILNSLRHDFAQPQSLGD